MNISKVPGCHLLQQMSSQWESQKLVRDTTADYPQHLQVEEDISLTKNCITISIQKISSIHIFILKMQQILGSPELTGHNHFGPHPPKNNWINFQLSSICTSMQNISSFHLFILKTKSNFEFQVHTSRSHFWQCLKFYEPSIFVDLDQLAKKNEALSSICSGETVDLHILQPDWLRAFWLIFQEQDLSQYRICAGTQQII